MIRRFVTPAPHCLALTAPRCSVYGGPAAQIVTHSSALLKGRNSHNGALCAEGFAVAMVRERPKPLAERPAVRRVVGAEPCA